MLGIGVLVMALGRSIVNLSDLTSAKLNTHSMYIIYLLYIPN